jgi:hypothetical protein
MQVHQRRCSWGMYPLHQTKVCCIITHGFVNLQEGKSKTVSIAGFHHGCPGLSMWDLWWKKWHWYRLFFELFSSSLSVSFHCGSPYLYIIWGMSNTPDGGHSSETVSPHRHEQEEDICSRA